MRRYVTLCATSITSTGKFTLVEALHRCESFKSFRKAYRRLCEWRVECADTYHEGFDKPEEPGLNKRLYITLRGERWESYYHPANLPRKLASIEEVLDPKSKLQMPPMRMLLRVVQHRRWLACLCAAQEADRVTPHPDIPNRETTRFISVSQPTSAGALDVAPDGTWATTVHNLEFSTVLQRRHGFNLSYAKGVHDAAERAGIDVDRLGDRHSSGSRKLPTDHTRRHNGANNKVYDMVSAVAIGQVIKGDKESREEMWDLNNTTISDVVELEGDDAHAETKVASPFAKTPYSLGKGTRKHGGCAASVGHLYAGGNTEERYRVTILGVRQRGRKCDGPFDHSTGKGWVKAKVGSYDDPLQQGARVNTMIVESTGALTPRSVAFVGKMARRTRGKRARDGTKYGGVRVSARAFFTHHTQRISMAAACGDVHGIHRNIRALRQRLVADGGLTAGARA